MGGVMETTLHRQLKRIYATDASSTEVVLGRFRIDAVRDDELIEIQCASLSAIRNKSQQLLRRHRLRVVKPVVLRTRIVKRKHADGTTTSRRMSPKRGHILDLFDELIYFTRVFPHPNLVLEVPLIHVQETRLPAKKRRRRWHRDYRVHDICLESIEGRHEFRHPGDLLELFDLPDADDFDTAQLARVIDRPRWFAQKIAYVLRNVGAIEAADRTRSGIRYVANRAA
jgi:hypothetical protein